LSKDFKLNNIEGYLRGAFNKNTKMAEDTKEWLQNAIDTYSKSKSKTISDNLEKPQEETVVEEVVEKTEEEVIIENTTTKPKTNQDKIDELEKEREEKLAQVGEVEETIPSNQPITEEEYNDFIDNGNVTEERLNNIAEKIKRNNTLSQQEIAIFNDKTSEINITLKTKVNEKSDADNSAEVNKMNKLKQKLKVWKKELKIYLLHYIKT
jgi:hypothetical protein